jgi:hypothetical protein
MNEEQKLIRDLHEQLFYWMKASTKKDKWKTYGRTTNAMKSAEKYLQNHNIEIPEERKVPLLTKDKK